MPRLPLTEEERKTIAERRTLPGAVQLSHRQVDSLSLAALALDGAQVEDCGLTEVDLRQARIANSSFQAVDFAADDLSGANIEATRFDGCTFANIVAAGAAAARSVFTGPVPPDDEEAPSPAMDRIRLDGATFEDVTFGGYDLANSQILNTRFLRCRFTGVSADGGEFTTCLFEGQPAPAGPEGGDAEPEPDAEAEDLHEDDEDMEESPEAGFLQVDLTAVSLKDCVFRGIVFGGVGLSGATLENCRLEDCLLDGLRAEATVFRKCVFRGCRLNFARFEGGSFTDCEFIDTTADDVLFDGASLCRTSFTGKSALKDSGFANARLEEVVFDGASLADVEFSKPSGSGVRFSGATLSDVGVRYGACSDLVIQGGQVSGMCFSDMTLERLAIRECQALDVQVVRSRVRDADIAAGDAADLAFTDSEICGLTVPAGDFGLFKMENCDVSPGCELRNIRVGVCNLSGSTFRGLHLAHAAFGELLLLDGARFEDLSLEDVRYGSELGSARFPECPVR